MYIVWEDGFSSEGRVEGEGGRTDPHGTRHKFHLVVVLLGCFVAVSCVSVGRENFSPFVIYAKHSDSIHSFSSCVPSCSSSVPPLEQYMDDMHPLHILLCCSTKPTQHRHRIRTKDGYWKISLWPPPFGRLGIWFGIRFYALTGYVYILNMEDVKVFFCCCGQEEQEESRLELKLFPVRRCSGCGKSRYLLTILVHILRGWTRELLHCRVE